MSFVALLTVASYGISRNFDSAGANHSARHLRLADNTSSFMKILGICGSLQAKSKNLALLSAASTLVPAGTELILFDGLRDLPHFNPDIQGDSVPPSVLRWRQALVDSDAVLIASPEYGFSLPGVVKNAIDWVIGSGELEGKVVATTAAVPGPERGRRGLQALRDTLSAVRATIVGGEPIQIGPAFERQLTVLLQTLIEAAAQSATPQTDFRSS